MLLSSRRRRFGTYNQLASPAPRRRSKWVGVFLILLLVAWGANAFYGMFASSVDGQRVATVLESIDGEGVRFAINDDEEQRAEVGLGLYDGESLQTSAGSYARLRFFDGTTMLLNERSSLLLEEVIAGEEESLLSAELTGGGLWVETGTGVTVTRTIDTPLARYVLPPRTRALLSIAEMAEGGESIAILTTSGPGAEVLLRNSGRPPATVVVGEGQQLTMTPSSVAQIREGKMNAYEARDVIQAGVMESAFYLRSVQQKDIVVTVSDDPSMVPVEEGEPLTIDEPKDGAFLQGSTVIIKGRIGPRVTAVRVDGYSATLKDLAFEKEIALPENEEFVIEVQAEDRDGLVIATKELSLSHDIRPPDPPRITSPGGSGSVVSMQEDSFEIVGDAPADTTGIIVNGYQLQKFVPGQPWRYLVDSSIGNVRIGENIYEVVGLDRGGNRSAPVRITIVWRAESLPPSSPDENLPQENNAALFPGSLRVIAPTADGSAFVTNEEEVLIEGETHPDTAAISINGFTLTKYLAGKTTWNYLANADYGNYRLGKNLYTIVARNAEGKILDVVRYTIEKTE